MNNVSVVMSVMIHYVSRFVQTAATLLTGVPTPGGFVSATPHVAATPLGVANGPLTPPSGRLRS